MTDGVPPVDSPDQYIAEDVRQRLRTFPRRFEQLDAVSELRSLLTEKSVLRGPMVHQKPESFTQQYLIEPILDGLGYPSPSSEAYGGDGPHFVRDPSAKHVIESKRPDYLLDTGEGTTICLLEAKAANRERVDGSPRDATEQVGMYTDENVFSKYRHTVDQQYLAAIATDGFRWKLWGKDVIGGDGAELIQTYDFSPSIQTISDRLSVIESTISMSSARIRRDLETEFVPYFGAENLPNALSDELQPRRYYSSSSAS
ncbi:hypothetical protein [Halalkalicoccus sp. NIPERK01]|uniref:hypothetical protein n=1 Tax=Halalkalicoccus sp. NIPERK01 TaxID=3053469 RepID=UPI00256EE948|nr:hypothetical protein [Halalkalicoccus sp. NIPERK01]MDL5361713.1 hypothetical protein [Halalkalicoccus sp. NIPERK01]